MIFSPFLRSMVAYTNENWKLLVYQYKIHIGKLTELEHFIEIKMNQRATYINQDMCLKVLSKIKLQKKTIIQ